MTKLQQSVYVLAFFILAVAGAHFAAPFLVPVVLSAVLAMLFIRLCNYFESKHIGRAYAALYCILLFLIGLGVIITLLSIQLSELTENIGPMKTRLSGMLESFKGWINETVGIKKTAQQKIIDKGTSENSGSMMFGFASGLLSIATNAILVMVYMYLFLNYRTHLKKFILKLVPRKENADTTDVIHETGKVAQRYLSGLAAMIGMLWVMYGIGFSIVGVEGALFFAILCGLLEIIPFVGNLTGTAITVFAVIAQGGDGKMLIGVLVTYFLVQFIQTYLIEPLIVGEQVNINPLFTILAIVVGELVWGVAGMILAVPLLGMFKIICDSYPDLQPYGFLIGPVNPAKKQTAIFDKLKQWFGKKVEKKD
jgi:predicted PurR-regulated permease PerM